jgi:hypothetical protein
MKKQVLNLFLAGYGEQSIKEIMFGLYGIFHDFYGHKLTAEQRSIKERILKTVWKQFKPNN